MPQPVLLLGAGPAAYGFPLARIAGIRPVILVDTAAPGWARPFLSGHLAADPAREAETAGTIARYADGQRIAGVLTWTREHLVTAARITGHLGLPGLSHETARACADPVVVRALLARHRVPPDGPGDADGPLVSAETVVLDDEVRIAALTRTTPGGPGRLPLRHCVHAHDGLLHNRFLRQTVERAVRALGLTHAVAHVGLRVTERGPRVTGVAPYLPGDLIPSLVERATGVDLAEVALALACGTRVDVSPSRQRAAAVRFDESTDSRQRRRRMYWVAEGEDVAECDRALDAA
ncbi:hypothetical protein A6P39_028855 [Streptomyces sp. FXJ1.172]|uniref:hypothetical protein n=1 Tax=Streptomyces sp. FXJ1.172 TaxID=710705 RepID=UPI0007D04091|nr:hypothetical protein [Streptomyces sp. FXJ1.172]WEO97701.1 hypothetical protein A6P39_028855 [Streptomyces sp. FXJ1.172]